jgi:hypothetical protein
MWTVLYAVLLTGGHEALGPLEHKSIDKTGYKYNVYVLCVEATGCWLRFCGYRTKQVSRHNTRIPD